MKPAIQMSDAKRAMVWSLLGLTCLAVGMFVATNPELRTLVFLALQAHAMALTGTFLGFSVLINEVSQDRSTPVWLRILACTSLILASIVAGVIVALLGVWFLVLAAVFLVGAWFGLGRPKLPTWKEFNRG